MGCILSGHCTYYKKTTLEETRVLPSRPTGVVLVQQRLGPLQTKWQGKIHDARADPAVVDWVYKDQAGTESAAVLRRQKLPKHLHQDQRARDQCRRKMNRDLFQVHLDTFHSDESGAEQPELLEQHRHGSVSSVHLCRDHANQEWEEMHEDAERADALREHQEGQPVHGRRYARDHELRHQRLDCHFDCKGRQWNNLRRQKYATRELFTSFPNPEYGEDLTGGKRTSSRLIP